MTGTSTVSSPDQAAVHAAEEAAPVQHRALVIAARTFLVMLLVAALAVLGLGVLASLRGENAAETSGLLRVVFGRVFLIIGIGLAGFLGVPSVIGLWALAGANRVEAVPALPRQMRIVLGGIAVAAAVLTAAILLATGSAVSLVNLGLFGIVVLGAVGLAGATAFTPHRGRAIASGVALGAFLAVTGWVLVNAFIAPPIAV